jgi:carotenoid cleavage dioxygenase
MATVHQISLREGRADYRNRFVRTRWFEAEPTYVLHWLNAFEDGEERTDRSRL